MQKIVPHLWFDKEAQEAAEFYASVFKSSKIIETTHYPNAGQEITGMPAGTVMTVEFELAGQRFIALNGGPVFKINPSISFILNFDPSKDEQAQENLDALWEKLAQGGNILMPLQAYPFSKHYGWVQDKYGVSWQLILSDPTGEERPFITPSLMFVGDVCGKAEEAITFYLSVFKNTKQGATSRYPKGVEPDKEGTIMFADFMLENQWFAAMDSAQMHDFTFNEATSLLVNCKDQAEIDYYWQKLSADPKAEQCGWLKDTYGVAWQVVPENMNELVKSPKAMEAMLKMKKIDISKLKEAA